MQVWVRLLCCGMEMKRALACVVMVMALWLQPAGVRGQEAVVLSGGGARGLAHAGVLIGLERLGHDPDIVVGTSMGAVVGALYAAGNDTARIRQLIMDVPWDALFAPTRVLLGPERDLRQPMLSLDLDATTLRVSRGLLGQWRINRELGRQLFDANARARGDFDSLPRRYRAVAADLRSGDVVVQSHGDLARSVRASMAVPGFFAPVERDGVMLVDGAIVANLPVSVARSMGAPYDVTVCIDICRSVQLKGSPGRVEGLQTSKVWSCCSTMSGLAGPWSRTTRITVACRASSRLLSSPIT